MNEQVEIGFNWRDGRIYLSLQQVQQVLNGISADYTNNELCSMLNMFVIDNNRKAEQADEEVKRRQVEHEQQQEYKSE